MFVACGMIGMVKLKPLAASDVLQPDQNGCLLLPGHAKDCICSGSDARHGALSDSGGQASKPAALAALVPPNMPGCRGHL